MIVAKIKVIDNNTATQLHEIFVENTDLLRIDQTANQGKNGTNTLEMQAIAGYHEEHQTTQVVMCDIETADINSVTIQCEDAATSKYDYRVTVTLILEEDDYKTYEEAQQEAQLQKQALEIVKT
ncbi:MAG: hypothetical protein U0V72_00650 [Cytophagales bacterium]